jgi:hypothetical protein
VPQEIVAPAPERFRTDHVGGEVIRLAAAVQDAQGGIGRPWQKLDTLARMVRAGSITRGMQAAGWKFNSLFNAAGLDPLWASDPARVPVLTHSGRLPQHRGNAAARTAVLDSLEVLGGIQSPGGSCAWHVLGCEWTIAAWGLSRGWGGHRVDTRVATGILLADLGILRHYYGIA